MAVISERRGPVIGLSLLVWLLALGAGRSPSAAARPRAVAVRLAGLAIVYLPLVLLAGAALEPGQAAERLLRDARRAAAGGADPALLGGYRALAVASAADRPRLRDRRDRRLAADLALAARPNPGSGCASTGSATSSRRCWRCWSSAGTGAALAGFAPRLSPPAPRRSPSSSSACVAALRLRRRPLRRRRRRRDRPSRSAPRWRRRRSPRGGAARPCWSSPAPFAVLALLALVDLLSGANAHLTRSVLDAGGAGRPRRRRPAPPAALGPQLRRGRSSSSSCRCRRSRRSSLAAPRADRRLARRAAGDARRASSAPSPPPCVGTLANDSGALLLEIGTAYLLVFCGFAWAESRARRRPDEPVDDYP